MKAAIQCIPHDWLRKAAIQCVSRDWLMKAAMQCVLSRLAYESCHTVCPS